MKTIKITVIALLSLTLSMVSCKKEKELKKVVTTEQKDNDQEVSLLENVTIQVDTSRINFKSIGTGANYTLLGGGVGLVNRTSLSYLIKDARSMGVFLDSSLASQTLLNSNFTGIIDEVDKISFIRLSESNIAPEYLPVGSTHVNIVVNAYSSYEELTITGVFVNENDNQDTITFTNVKFDVSNF